MTSSSLPIQKQTVYASHSGYQGDDQNEGSNDEDDHSARQVGEETEGEQSGASASTKMAAREDPFQQAFDQADEAPLEPSGCEVSETSHLPKALEKKAPPPEQYSKGGDIKKESGRRESLRKVSEVDDSQVSEEPTIPPKSSSCDVPTFELKVTHGIQTEEV
jgi:hypothetical protein